MNKICRPKRTAISIAIAAAIASGWTGSYAGTTNGDPNLGDGAIATGNGSRAMGDYSVAIGSLSTGVAATGTALTTLSTSLAAGTVGLVQQSGGAPGTGTITIGATTGGTVVDVSGTAGARQIKGVAGGSDATDAVNVPQLQQLATTVGAIGAIGANAVVYDDASHAPRVTLGTPAASTPVALTNVADAVLTSASTDAVSGRQLYATNQTLAGLATGMAAGTVGLVQQAGGAPGAGAIAIGATTGGTIMDVSGTDGAQRTTGVAAGREATDAVNVTQLNQVAGAINAVASNAVSYYDPARVSVTLGGLHATSTVLLRNVASGALSTTSTDAVNGAQLFASNQAVQANTSAITELASQVGRIQASVPSQPVPSQQGSLKFVSVNSSGTAATASGTEAVAVGSNATALRTTPWRSVREPSLSATTPCRSATPQRGLRGRSPTFPPASRRPMRSTFSSSTTRWAACVTRSSMTAVTPMAVPRRPSRSRVSRKRRVPEPAWSQSAAAATPDSRRWQSACPRMAAAGSSRRAAPRTRAARSPPAWVPVMRGSRPDIHVEEETREPLWPHRSNEMRTTPTITADRWSMIERPRARPSSRSPVLRLPRRRSLSRVRASLLRRTA